METFTDLEDSHLRAVYNQDNNHQKLTDIYRKCHHSLPIAKSLLQSNLQEKPEDYISKRLIIEE